MTITFKTGMQAIATGSADTEDAAIDWLEAHGAQVERGPVTLIMLTKEAQISTGQYTSTYSIWFYGPDGNEEESGEYVDYYLNADAFKTTLRLIQPNKEAEYEKWSKETKPGYVKISI